MKIAEQIFEVVFSCAKWKLLQVVCTQPFNKAIHFGLSCLVFETKQTETHTDNHFDVDDEQRKVSSQIPREEYCFLRNK